MRVFKNKWSNRWARAEQIADTTLKAAEEIVSGKVEADLGGTLLKKRIARSGAGKSGGYRTLIGYKRPNSERSFFCTRLPKTKEQIFQITKKPP